MQDLVAPLAGEGALDQRPVKGALGEGMGEESAGYGGAPGNNGRQRVGRNVMEAPVTLKLRDVSIEMIMQLAMQQIGDHVTFSIREGVVVIGVPWPESRQTPAPVQWLR